MLKFEMRSTIRGARAPRIPFEKLAAQILPRGYSLSLVICADKLARNLNYQTRKKTYSPNVLSFEISKTSGEIILNLRKAENEARQLKIPTRDRAAHLFIHGCLHLAGKKHGNSMDALEDKTLRKFGFRIV